MVVTQETSDWSRVRVGEQVTGNTVHPVSLRGLYLCVMKKVPLVLIMEAKEHFPIQVGLPNRPWAFPTELVPIQSLGTWGTGTCVNPGWGALEMQGSHSLQKKGPL